MLFRSLLAAKAAGKGKGLARTLRKWMWIEDRTNLPVNTYGRHKCLLLEDEDLAQELYEHLQSLIPNTSVPWTSCITLTDPRSRSV